MNTFDFTLLNNEQQKALLETEGAVLVTAGAGSGKTRLLTHRIAYLIIEKGISPYNILAITFTNKAADEMKNRVCLMIDSGVDVWISTFHSMCVKILRNNINRLEGYTSSFSIYSDSDQEKVIKTIFEELGLNNDELKKSVLFHIGNIKNGNFSPDKYALENDYIKDMKTILTVYYKYEATLKANNALDFDDLLIKAYDLLKNNNEVLEYYSSRFRYILVDEFQDTNTIQYELVKLLSSKHGNIFVVGDEDQCIYSWRGANFRNIFNFQNNFSNVKVFKLEQNYRSTRNILNYANRVIKNNRSRLEKTLYTDNKEGFPIENYGAYDERDEADYVSKMILYLNEKYDYKFSDIAVLSRLNALSLPFEENFLAYNIPYKIFGGFKFFDRVEIKNIIAYLRVFLNENDDISFLRIINFPKKGIGENAIKKLREFAEIHNLSLINACVKIFKDNINNSVLLKFLKFGEIYNKLKTEIKVFKLDEFVISVIDQFAIKNAYNKNNEQDLDKLLNIDAFISNCQELTSKMPQVSLCDYLESISLISDLDEFNNEDNHVKFATIHSAKGLEFKVVFIIGLEERIFPILKGNSSDDLEEERRLLYVAITRAKERLFFTRAKSRFHYGKRDYMVPSRFLEELGFVDKKSPLQTKITFSGFTSKIESFIDNNLKVSSKIEDNLLKDKKDISIFKTGQHVSHTRFGNGFIQSINFKERFADVDFEGYGIKTLMLDIAPLTILE